MLVNHRFFGIVALTRNLRLCWTSRSPGVLAAATVLAVDLLWLELERKTGVKHAEVTVRLVQDQRGWLRLAS